MPLGTRMRWGDDLRLLHGAEDIALFDDVARLDGRDEVPFALSVEAVDGDAARNAVAALEKERCKRALDAVENAVRCPGPSSAESGSPVETTSSPGP